MTPQPYAAGPPPAEKPVSRPFGAVYAGHDQPPPPPQAIPVNSMGVQQDASQEKKSKYGKFGNTTATSTAGGSVNAAAAIGSGIVGAIF